MTHEKYMDMLRFQVSKRKIIGVEYCVDGWETIVFEKNRLRRVISKNVIRKI
jgi:hypothetical protein